jgi:hypothetical protein
MQAVEHPLGPEELNEYLDGELPPERAAVVQAHVAGCASCQKLSEDLQHVSRDLATWTVEKSPDTIAAEDLLGRGGFSKSWRPRWLSASFGVPAASLGLAAVVLLIVGFAQYDRMREGNVDRRLRVGKVASTAADSAPASTALTYSEGLSSPVPAPAELPFGGLRGQIADESIVAPASHVIRTATLRLISKDFDASRALLDRIVASTGGLLGDVTVTGVRTEVRSLKATVRVPAPQFDKMLAELKGLGDVVNEAMSADDVTEQVIDLDARLANARNTEQRMKELLRTRTGKLTEVLEAEREVSRVREEIERLAAQRKNIASKVAYGTITLTMEEPPKASISLGPLPLSLRLRNAFVEGFRTAFESAVGAVLFFLQAGPFAIVWLVFLGIPIRFLWRRYASA